jgi:hypothetical protein
MAGLRRSARRWHHRRVAWKMTVRSGPRVTHETYGNLDAALAALEAKADELAGNASGEALDVKVRRFAPADQVSARIELAGPERLLPSVRGGVDIRGDASVQAYLGRVRREALKPRRGESPYAALRRALSQV